MIREDISKVLGYRIEKDRWEESIKALDSAGKITLRKVLDMVIVVCKHIEKNE